MLQGKVNVAVFHHNVQTIYDLTWLSYIMTVWKGYEEPNKKKKRKIGEITYYKLSWNEISLCEKKKRPKNNTYIIKINPQVQTLF